MLAYKSKKSSICNKITWVHRFYEMPMKLFSLPLFSILAMLCYCRMTIGFFLHVIPRKCICRTISIGVIESGIAAQQWSKQSSKSKLFQAARPFLSGKPHVLPAWKVCLYLGFFGLFNKAKYSLLSWATLSPSNSTFSFLFFFLPPPSSFSFYLLPAKRNHLAPY